MYQDAVDKTVQEQIIKTLQHERFGYNNYGYFFIINTKYEMIFHIDPLVYKLDHYNLQDTEGKYLVRDFVDIATNHGIGFSEYHWYLPGATKSSRKITHIRYIPPEWDWIVATGFYFENLEEQMLLEQGGIINRVLNNNLRITSIIIFILFLLVTLISFFLYKRIRGMEDAQEVYTNDLLQYKAVIDKSALVSITDINGIITHVNQQLCKLTGYSFNDL